MLKDKHRLKSPRAFRSLLAQDTPFFKNRCFVVYATEQSAGEPQPTRFGIIISKKVDKRAVVRNKIKRQLRETIRRTLLTQYRDRLEKYSAFVIIVRQATLDLSYKELERNLLHVLKV